MLLKYLKCAWNINQNRVNLIPNQVIYFIIDHFYYNISYEFSQKVKIADPYMGGYMMGYVTVGLLSITSNGHSVQLSPFYDNHHWLPPVVV